MTLLLDGQIRFAFQPRSQHTHNKEIPFLQYVWFNPINNMKNSFCLKLDFVPWAPGLTSGLLSLENNFGIKSGKFQTSPPLWGIEMRYQVYSYVDQLCLLNFAILFRDILQSMGSKYIWSCILTLIVLSCSNYYIYPF